MHKLRFTALIIFLLLGFNSIAQYDKSYWPKQIEIDGIVITIYDPEPGEF